MTSQTKASTAASLDLTGLVDGQQADAADVSVPLAQAAVAVDRARSKLSVTANDTHIKELNDALTVGSGITKSVVNPAGDENLQLMIDTAIVATLTGAQTLSNKILLTPTIASMINATHNHENAAGGGQINASNVFSGGTVPVARLPVMVGTNGVTPGTAGLVPAPLAADSGKLLRADGTWVAVAGTGTVTNVGLSLPSEFSVSGSPVTAAGTLAGSWVNQSGNKVLASPSGGGSGAPTFRTLVAADIPSLSPSKMPAMGWVEIFDNIVLGSDADFSISSIPASYRHLCLIVSLRSNRAAVNDNLRISFNGDATAGAYVGLHSRVSHSATWVTVESLIAGGAQSFSVVQALTGGTSPANMFGFGVIWIYDYAGAGFKHLYYEGMSFMSETTGNPKLIYYGGLWRNTAAITSIGIAANTGVIASGSSYSLYGVGQV